MARPTATSTTSRASSSTSSSLTTTVTVENDPAAYSSSSSSSSRPQETLVLELRPRKKQVTWKEGTVDNEFMNKRSSKICCVFHKEKPFDEEDSDDDCHDHYHGHPSNGNGPSNDSCRPNTSKINMSPNIGDDLTAMFLDSDVMSDTSTCPTWTVMVQFLVWLHSLPAMLYQVASWYLLAIQTTLESNM